jgi:hypothetical protein
MILVGIIVFTEAITYADDIRNEGRLREAPRLELFGFVIPILETEAYAARVLWKDPSKIPSSFQGESASCLIELGRSGSTAVVYDFKNKKPISFPLGDAVIERDTQVTRLPDSCSKASS